MSAARYVLVTRNSPRVVASGLVAGDVLAIGARGEAVLLRETGYAPPLAVRARLEAEGSLQPLDPLKPAA